MIVDKLCECECRVWCMHIAHTSVEQARSAYVHAHRIAVTSHTASQRCSHRCVCRALRRCPDLSFEHRVFSCAKRRERERERATPRALVFVSLQNDVQMCLRVVLTSSAVFLMPNHFVASSSLLWRGASCATMDLFTELPELQ